MSSFSREEIRLFAADASIFEAIFATSSYYLCARRNYTDNKLGSPASKGGSPYQAAIVVAERSVDIRWRGVARRDARSGGNASPGSWCIRYRIAHCLAELTHVAASIAADS